MNLLYRVESRSGVSRVISPGGNDLRYLSFSLLRLAANETFRANSDGEELAIILLNGECRLRIGSLEEDLGPRTSVFTGYAAAAYAPRRTEYEARATEPTELAICGATVDADTEPVFIRPSDIGIRHVGAGNWSRTVTDIIGQNVGARRLIVGETYNPPGNWSSAPPHRHDNDNPPVESEMEEVYFYRLQPPQGFGLQRVYDDSRGLDAVYTVKHDDVVALPFGYHPVVAAPGYELYYLWALAGDKRELIPYDDPEHAWVKRV